VREEAKALETHYINVGDVSLKYFDQLNKLAHGIQNDKLKYSELEKNKYLKKNWTEAYRQAGIEIKKIRNLLKDGDDFHKIILGNMLRTNLEENICELKVISKNARIILNELKKLTLEGRKLVEK